MSGERVNPKLMKKAKKLHDKRIKKAKSTKGSFKRGIIASILAAVLFIGVPLVMIYVVQPTDSEYVKSWDKLVPFFWRWFYAGIPLVILAFPDRYYVKGSRGRLWASIIYLAASILWLVIVLNFGNLSDLIVVQVNNSTYEFGMVLKSMLGIMVFYRTLKVLTIYGIYKDNRKQYLKDIKPLLDQQEREKRRAA